MVTSKTTKKKASIKKTPAKTRKATTSHIAQRKSSTADQITTPLAYPLVILFTILCLIFLLQAIGNYT